MNYYNANKWLSDIGKRLIRTGMLLPTNWVIGFYEIQMEEITTIKQRYAKKIVCLIRTPRDCLASLYFYRVYHKTGILGALRRWFSVNIMKKRFVVQTLRNWRKHVEDYHGFADEIIRYEDLIDDCFGALKSLISPEDTEKLRNVVERNSFEAITGRKPGKEQKDAFARKGIIGDWRNHFDQPKYRAIIKDIVGKDLIRFGYQTDMTW